MNYKILLITLVACLFFVSATEAKGLRYTLGLKNFTAYYYFEDLVTSEDIESELGDSWGVTANMRGEKWVVGVNSLSGKFDFSNIDGYFDRSEVDFYGGYYFHPQVAALVGYKYIVYEWDDGLEDTYSGPVLAVNAYYPLPFYSSVVFGTLSYVFVSNTDYEDDSANGPTLEVGFAGPILRFPSWSYSVAYKYQTYESTETYHDVTGVTFGLNYSF